MKIDDSKLRQLVGGVLNDLGGAASVAMVRMGDALGQPRTSIRDTFASGSPSRPHRTI
jgi:hypothetical protein